MKNVNQWKLMDMLNYVNQNSRRFIINQNKSYDYKMNKYRQKLSSQTKSTRNCQKFSAKKLIALIAVKFLCSPNNFFDSNGNFHYCDVIRIQKQPNFWKIQKTKNYENS